MSDSEDDFVEVSGYQSNDSSDWEKISRGGESEEEEGEEELVPARASKDDSAWPDELMASYYQSPPSNRRGDLNNNNATVPTIITDTLPLKSKEYKFSEGAKKKGKKKKTGQMRPVWNKVSLKRGSGAPYDPVEFLGITGGEKALLGHFSITTIGQLAYFNAMDFVSSTNPEKFAILLDLQERAYEAVTEYVTKASAQPEVVWGYLYLSDKSLKDTLRKGFLDSDALYFLWSPMPAVTYRDQIAIDDLVGIETKDRELRSRYSRFVKINLTKLCSKYYGRLYQRDPFNSASEKWFNLSLLEAAEVAQRGDDLWYAFEPGNDIFSRVTHGSIVIPTGRIPQDCMELDKETCVFAKRVHSGDSSDDEREESNPTVASKLECFY